MTIYAVNIDGNNFKVVKFTKPNKQLKDNELNVKTTAYTKKYMPLITALLERITTKQLNTISFKGIIIFNDLINCFKHKIDHDLQEIKCICKVVIKNSYHIFNIETLKVYVVGSECIRNWLTKSNLEVALINKEMEKRKKEGNDNKEVKLCYFCMKNITNRKCLSCDEQKTLTSNIFEIFKKMVSYNKQIKTNVINQWKAYKKDIYTPLLKRFFRKCRIYYKYKNCMKSIITPDKTYILVPFSEISYAKMFGAIFDKDRKMWYFISKSKYLDKYNIQYLDIPIYVKEKVKNIGAKWDNENKKWYCNKDMLLKNEFLNKYI